jgi:hypothetical protein
VKDQRPFRSRLFLFRLLACIFLFHGVLLWRAVDGCRNLTSAVNEQSSVQRSVEYVCPQIAAKAENLFNVAVATVLSLLGTRDTLF